jgi:polar amino acid transport system ATP-binding protein
MLLDEVMSALDPESAADVLDVIKELGRRRDDDAERHVRGGVARDIASRVCFLADGQILEQAPPTRLFSHPSDERTRRFLRRITDAGRQ